MCTLLIDLVPTDVRDPLAQFNHTTPSEEGMYLLVKTLNRALGDSCLEDAVLAVVFKTHWPHFKDRFDTIMETTPEPTPQTKRSHEDLLTEILSNTRSLSSRIGRLEEDVHHVRNGSLASMRASSEALSKRPWSGRIGPHAKDIIARKLRC